MPGVCLCSSIGGMAMLPPKPAPCWLHDCLAASSCVAAPAGSYVNTTGATTYKPCQVGFFSNEQGSDVCDRCPPGQYANTVGSKACKASLDGFC